MSEKANLEILKRVAANLSKHRAETLDGVFLPRPKQCTHSVFPGNAKQRRYMRRWHRKNNPTCNDTLMENLRLGRRCTG